MPLLPVLLLSLFQGIQAAIAIIQPHATKAWSAAIVPLAIRIPIGIVVVLITVWLWSYTQLDRTNHLALWANFRASYGWSGFGETFSWIKQNTRSADVLATAYDPMYYLYTGRKAVRPWIPSGNLLLSLPQCHAGSRLDRGDQGWPEQAGRAVSRRQPAGRIQRKDRCRRVVRESIAVVHSLT
jgi:hypothetical protein